MTLITKNRGHRPNDRSVRWNTHKKELPLARTPPVLPVPSSMTRDQILRELEKSLARAASLVTMLQAMKKEPSR